MKIPATRVHYITAAHQSFPVQVHNLSFCFFTDCTKGAFYAANANKSR